VEDSKTARHLGPAPAREFRECLDIARREEAEDLQAEQRLRPLELLSSALEPMVIRMPAAFRVMDDVEDVRPRGAGAIRPLVTEMTESRALEQRCCAGTVSELFHLLRKNQVAYAVDDHRCRAHA
jgi:hypothetical protein